jgi:hypothetical protein
MTRSRIHAAARPLLIAILAIFGIGLSSAARAETNVYMPAMAMLVQASSFAQCGGQGQRPCDHPDIAATNRGRSGFWGCSGSQVYFTPRNGGECWRCPSGYRRTTTAIYKANACEKRGWSTKRVSATFVKSAYGCGAGLFHQGSSCWSCPAGYEKKPFSTSPVCQPVQRGCDTGYVKSPRPFKTLADQFGLSRVQYCTSIASAAMLPETFKTPIEQMETTVNTNNAIHKLVVDLAGPKGDAITDALKRKDYVKAFRMLKKMQSFREFALTVSDGYQTITLSASSGANVIRGADVEGGLAIDALNMRAKVFIGQTHALGLEASAGGSLNLGVWKGDVGSLQGIVQGVSAGVPFDAGLGVGAAQWFSMIDPNQPEEFLGQVWSLDVGLGIGTGQYLQAYTQLK